MTAYYNECDHFAAAWLRELMAAGLIAPGVVDEHPIQEVAPADVESFTQCHFFAGIGAWSYALRAAGWPDDRAVWTGSCPCQPFSAAGRRRGTADDRHLWPEWFRLIREHRPPVIFGEQVSSKDGLSWLDTVSSDLEGAAYAIGALDTCAAGVGAPHIRQRLYFVADAGYGECSRWGARHAGRQRWDAARCGAPRVLGDPGSNGDREHARQLHGHEAEHEERPADRDHAPVAPGAVGVALGDANSEGPQARTAEDLSREGRRIEGRAALESDGPPTRGFWRDAEWIPCRDGKFRPVEPGSFPLVAGAPARVGRLRGYGNALCSPQAETFIASHMDVRAGVA